MKTRIFILIISLTAVFTSCKKDRDIEKPSAPTVMEELQVPSNFDWKTTRDIQLTLVANTNGIAEVTNMKGIAYQKAYLTSAVPYVMKLTLPTYEKNVGVKFMGQTQTIELTSSILSISF